MRLNVNEDEENHAHGRDGGTVTARTAFAGQPEPGPAGAGAGAGTEAPRPVLAVDDLVVEYRLGHGRTLRAVDQVSFELGAGEVLGVVGESGSGKSTLGKVVAGFLNPTSGRVRLPSAAGELAPREQRTPRGHRDIQMIFQESAMALNPRLPVWRVVGEAIAPDLATFPAWRRSAPAELKAQAGGYLERAGLPAAAFADKRAAELSGGEKQRVAIARALAASPAALVCDESVSALDVSIRAVVLNLFQRLSREAGIAMVFISHDISVVAHLADRLAVMYHGRIVEYGDPAAIIEDPQDEYTRRLIAAVPTLERGEI
jgi:peptide/nickel transport system ATP-binding protein